MLCGGGGMIHRVPSCSVRFLHQRRPPVSDRRWPGWAIVVGLEVHAQVKTREKLFSGQYNLKLLLLLIETDENGRDMDFNVKSGSQY